MPHSHARVHPPHVTRRVTVTPDTRVPNAATLVIERAAGAEVPAPDSATLAAIAEATGLEPLKDVVMRDLKNKGDAEAEETRSIPERVDEFFR